MKRVGTLRLRALKLASYRPRSSSWPEHARAVRALYEAAATPAAPRPGPVDFAVVLLSYRRRQNLDLQIHLALSAPGARRVIVSNNDPAVPLAPSTRDPRLELVEQPREAGPIERYFVSRRVEERFILALDDDLFLLPEQLSRLAAALAADPDVPHGIYGQLWRPTGFVDNVTRAEGEVDLLNRVYAFTPQHLARYFELLQALEVRSPDALRDLDDDLPLAFCGVRRPRIHDLGPFADCPSERSLKLARWRRKRAAELRTDLFERLRALVPLERRGSNAAVPS